MFAVKQQEIDTSCADAFLHACVHLPQGDVLMLHNKQEEERRFNEVRYEQESYLSMDIIQPRMVQYHYNHDSSFARSVDRKESEMGRNVLNIS